MTTAVKIPRATLRKFDNEIHASLHILEALRAAEIPVRGTLAILGVSRGVLEMVDELDDGEEVVAFYWNAIEAEPAGSEFA